MASLRHTFPQQLFDHKQIFVNSLRIWIHLNPDCLQVDISKASMLCKKKFYKNMKWIWSKQSFISENNSVCCMKCLQTAMVIQEKSFHQSRNKYSWCKYTHTHTHAHTHTHHQHNIRGLTANGGMVTPWWTLTEAPSAGSPHQTHFTAPQTTSPVKFTRLQALRALNRILPVSANLFSQCSVLHFYICMFSWASAYVKKWACGVVR